MKVRWIWGAYVLSLAWVGLLFFHVHRFMSVSRTEIFRQEGRRLVSLWAERIAEAGDDQRQARVLRRLSGEMDTRSASLLNDEGQSLLTVGDPAPAPPRIPLSEPSDRSLTGDAWVYWAPLWVDGRRAGYVVWVRDSSSLKKERAHFQRGLLAAGTWWAALGALGAAYAARLGAPGSDGVSQKCRVGAARLTSLKL